MTRYTLHWNSLDFWLEVIAFLSAVLVDSESELTLCVGSSPKKTLPKFYKVLFSGFNACVDSYIVLKLLYI